MNVNVNASVATQSGIENNNTSANGTTQLASVSQDSNNGSSNVNNINLTTTEGGEPPTNDQGNGNTAVNSLSDGIASVNNPTVNVMVDPVEVVTRERRLVKTLSQKFDANALKDLK
jgi:hypothetical protein